MFRYVLTTPFNRQNWFFKTVQINYYEILEISSAATGAEIKKAYRKLALQWHPDRNNDPLAESHFREITLAYETLSDPLKKADYDKGKTFYKDPFSNFSGYTFELRINNNQCLAFEELQLSFVYTGEGRYLRKPDLRYFHLAGKPIVTFSSVYKDGRELRQTVISYNICPIAAGNFSIGPAHIKIQGKEYTSNLLFVNASKTNCFFSNGQQADGKPFRLTLYTKAEAGGKNHQYTVDRQHVLLIPRSHKAHVYHTIGYILKIAFAAWGLFLAIRIHQFMWFGFIAGSVYGGLMAYLLYAIVKVKPKFYFAQRYSIAAAYFAKGYTLYPTSQRNLVNRFFIYISRLLS